MLNARFQIRKQACLLLFMVAGCSTLVSTATAADTFFSKPDLGDLMDGDVTVARMGQRGPAVHMSFISPADVRVGKTVTASAVRQSTAMPEVYLSVRLPW